MEIGSRWTRPDFNPDLGEYIGYTVIAITNTENEHPNHPPQVIYEGDNGKVWSLPKDKWPGNLIPEPLEHEFNDEAVEAIANCMIHKYGFKVTKENMEVAMTNFTNALVDAMESLYNVESDIFAKLMQIGAVEGE